MTPDFTTLQDMLERGNMLREGHFSFRSGVLSRTFCRVSASQRSFSATAFVTAPLVSGVITYSIINSDFIIVSMKVGTRSHHDPSYS